MRELRRVVVLEEKRRMPEHIPIAKKDRRIAVECVVRKGAGSDIGEHGECEVVDEVVKNSSKELYETVDDLSRRILRHLFLCCSI